MQQIKSKADLRERMEKLDKLSLEIQQLTDDNAGYWPEQHFRKIHDEEGCIKKEYEDKWDYIQKEVQPEYDELWSETINLYGNQQYTNIEKAASIITNLVQDRISEWAETRKEYIETPKDEIENFIKEIIEEEIVASMDTAFSHNEPFQKLIFEQLMEISLKQIKTQTALL